MATGTIKTGNVLPVNKGGTGQSSLTALRNSMGLGNTTGALPIANGGTGATSAASARSNLNASGSLSIASVATGDFSLASNASVTKRMSTTRSGYTAIGIVGYNIGRTFQFQLNTLFFESNGDVTVIVYNRGTGTITGNVSVQVLYARNN